MSDRKLRVGMIGANWSAQAHLPAWRHLPDVEVRAICTTRPETAKAAAEKHDIACAYHDFREMVAADDIDIIDIGARPVDCYPIVTAALDQRKHVFSSMPFAASHASALDMVSRWRTAGTVAIVDAPAQAVPAMAYLKALIDEGQLGEIFGIRASLDLPNFTAAQTNMPKMTWFGDPANGTSAFRNLGSHILHPLVHIFGRVESIVSDQSIRLRSWPMKDAEAIQTRVPDTTYAIARFATGISGQLSFAWSMVAGLGTRIEVWGARGHILLTAPLLPQSQSRLYFNDNPAFGERLDNELSIPDQFKTIAGTQVHADQVNGLQFPMTAVYRSLVDEILGAGKAAPNFDQALHVHEILDAASRSSDERRWVDISEISQN